MLYENFSDELKEYIEMYLKGLKKQANNEIEDTIARLGASKPKEIDEILFRFLTEYCDENKWMLIKSRGNADVPFALKEFIRPWLEARCEKKSMPELRWYYEMFRNHREGYKYAIEYLEEAYNSDKCDQRTIDLLFDSYLDILGWGAHHFPDGCIIEKSAKEKAIENCEKIMSEKHVSEMYVNQLNYYIGLYDCYDKYKANGEEGDFEEFCEKNGLKYQYTRAFFYEY